MTGEVIKDIRLRLNMSQKRFGEYIGVSANSVARWERNELGIRKSIQMLIRILTKDIDHTVEPSKTSRGTRRKKVAKSCL